MKAASFESSRLSASFEIAEAKGVVRCRLKDSRPGISSADIYYDKKNGTLSIYAKRMGDYARLALSVAGQVDLPAEPQWHATQNMEVAVHMLLRKMPPVLDYEKLFSKPEPSPAQKAELDGINAFMREMNERRNHGMPYSLEETAARYGVSMENAQRLAEMLERKEREFDIELEVGFPGIPIPSPEDRMKLKERLADNILFRFNAGEEAERLFREMAPRIEALRGKPRGAWAPRRWRSPICQRSLRISTTASGSIRVTRF